MAGQTPTRNLVRMLRAIANGSDAKASQHDLILVAAADRLEAQAAILRRYRDGDPLDGFANADMDPADDIESGGLLDDVEAPF